MVNPFTHQQAQPIQKKRENIKIAVVLVDTRTGRDLWLCQSFLYLCYFVNRFLASKPSNGFQSKTVRNVYITVGLPDDA